MNAAAHRYFVVNKPAGMVSQFVSSHRVTLLGDLAFDFPEGTHAIGRLDNDSEGLLLLTTNKRVTRLLFSGPTQHPRRYLVQVNNTPDEAGLELLRVGLPIRVKGGGFYTTAPCEVERVAAPLPIYPWTQQEHAHGTHSWLLITLREGKFHQVRKMIGAIRHRCRRLIRISIADLQLNGLPPGQVREITRDEFFRWLKLSPVKKEGTS